MNLRDLLAQQVAPSSWAQWVDGIARTPLSKVVIFLGACTFVRLLLLPFLPERPDDGGIRSLFRILSDTLDSLVYAGGVVFLLIRPFVLQTFWIPSGSMLNTLQLNDFIVANKWVYRVEDPKPGDIIVFQPPAAAITPFESPKDFIKRVVGVPGQIVEIRHGQLYRDGKAIREPYVTIGEAEYDWRLVKDGDRYIPLTVFEDGINTDTRFVSEKFWVDPFDAEKQERLRALPPVAIPKDYFLMIGDNRPNSFDGRAWGLVHRRNLIGRADAIFLPFSRAALL